MAVVRRGLAPWIFLQLAMESHGVKPSKAHRNARGISVSRAGPRALGFPGNSVCFPARWKDSSARSPKRSTGFCSHLLLIYAMAPCNFPKADGRFSSFRQESGPRRLIYFGALLACENRPKAERGGTPYCKCTHATQTQLMPDIQMLTLLIRSLCYCRADEQIPKDGHLLSPANKQTTVEKGAINKAVNQLKLNI